MLKTKDADPKTIAVGFMFTNHTKQVLGLVWSSDLTVPLELLEHRR